MSATTMMDALDEAWPSYWSALEAGDAGRAVDVARAALATGVSLVDVLDRLVAAAQVEVGRRWAANAWNVAQEHRATSISEEVVAALTPRRAPHLQRGRAVVCCVDGEWHALPARIVTAVLVEAGFEVHHLGASVPASHLVQYVHDVGPAAVGLSCSVSTALPRARRMIEGSRQAGVPVIVGGAGFGAGGRWGLALGADAVATDARGALAVLTDPAWPAFTDPAPQLGPSAGVAARLLGDRARVVSGAARHLGDSPAVDELGALVDYLAASVLVDDPQLFRGATTWLGDVLAARRLPPGVLADAVGALAAELADSPDAAALLPMLQPRPTPE